MWNKVKVEIIDKNLEKYEPFLKKGSPFASAWDLKAITIQGLVYQNNNKVNDSLVENINKNFRENQHFYLKPGQRVLLGTNIRFSIPTGVEAEIRSRSSLPYKRGLMIANGVGTIDNDYIGEIKVALINVSSENIKITPGERIAQILFKKSYIPYLKYVKNIVKKTFRGIGGFGSSGKF